MKPGPRPQPTDLKLYRGNPGKRPTNQNEPRPEPKSPGMPTWLSNEARAEWRRLVPELDKIGMLGRVDRAALATYCELWSTFVAAERVIHEHGITIMKKIHEDVTLDETGETVTIYIQPVKNPALQVARDAAAQIRGFCAEFGLTPSARTRIDLPERDEPTGGLESLLS